MNKKQKSVLLFNHKEAKKFFLKSESYINTDLPPYFNFSELLKKVDELLTGKSLYQFIPKSSEKPSEYEKNNYVLLDNKDGKYAWRPIELIHPAIYVDLVNKITQKENWKTIKDRFEKFSKNKKIICESIPVDSLDKEKDQAAQISQWWHEVEQKSIELALDYNYVIQTDITNCYGSIYTHSIAWALHDRDKAKKKKNDFKLIGNYIDRSIRDMNFGQTNGIPQGSVLMDFIAEMVLGYIDFRFSRKIKDDIKHFKIIRYRDDYRIFANNPVDAEQILKLISEILIDFGMEFNSAKTTSSSDLIRSSIKEDKLAWLEKQKLPKNFQKRLLIIHNHGKQYPNSGSLEIVLSDFHKRLIKRKKLKIGIEAMISIVVEIAFHNPRTYPNVAAILSTLISRLDDKKLQKSICKKIYQKFQKIPNTGYMQIWIQRFSMFYKKDIKFKEKLTKVVNVKNTNEKLWNSEWMEYKKLKPVIDDPTIIIDKDVIDEIGKEINPNEVGPFAKKY